ncbi:hypothetical protein, partial [Chryseobacterium indoltheticum]|uniref:hypothetical protein n=1 Tax=Chryseobacterium indoltheticum TaxID=254 RepID=UPI003F4958C6
LRSISGGCLAQVERSRIGVFRIYRETLSRFSCAASYLKVHSFYCSDCICKFFPFYRSSFSIRFYKSIF